MNWNKNIARQYAETVDYVRMMNAKESQRGNVFGKAEREAYVQRYEQAWAKAQVRLDIETRRGFK